MNDKAALREIMAKRRAAAAAEADPRPALSTLQTLLAQARGPISFYWPIRSEVDPRPVMAACSAIGPVCLPVTHGRGTGLTFHPWMPGIEMAKDGFGVPYPVNGPAMEPETLVVPLLGFDQAGQRLGYGAGHYDRTLARLRAAGPVLAVGLAFASQRLDDPLPAEPTDEPLDIIVTEAGTFRPI